MESIVCSLCTLVYSIHLYSWLHAVYLLYGPGCSSQDHSETYDLPSEDLLAMGKADNPP